MGNLKLDPNDPLSYGYVDESGKFNRLGRFPTKQEAERRMNEAGAWFEKMHFDNDRQRVQYENIVGKPPGSHAGWTDYNFTTAPSEHYNARCDTQPVRPSGKFVSKRNRAGVMVWLESSLTMPDGQRFPDEAYTGYMWDFPESKESDGMPDAVKRYRPKGFRSINDIELAEQLNAAAQRYRQHLQYDPFSGSAPG